MNKKEVSRKWKVPKEVLKIFKKQLDVRTPRTNKTNTDTTERDSQTEKAS